MATFNEFLQDYVNKSYEDLLAFANISMSNLADEMERYFADSETLTPANAYIIIIASCLGVDGKLTELEYRFLCDLLGNTPSASDYEATKSLVASFGDAEGREITDQFVDSLSSDGKNNLLMFCLAFFAVDETISADEVSFLKKLMA